MFYRYQKRMLPHTFHIFNDSNTIHRYHTRRAQNLHVRTNMVILLRLKGIDIVEARYNEVSRHWKNEFVITGAQ